MITRFAIISTWALATYSAQVSYKVPDQHQALNSLKKAHLVHMRPAPDSTYIILFSNNASFKLSSKNGKLMIFDKDDYRAVWEVEDIIIAKALPYLKWPLLKKKNQESLESKK